MSDDLVLRAAGPEDDAGIRAVVAAAFPGNPKASAEVTRWQYWDNPFGQTRAQVWDDGGHVVGCYVAYPLPVTLGGRRTVAALGVDAAIAPTHQGRRLFEPLARALYADVAAAGVPLTICYPNEGSTRGITRAGWVPIARLRTHVLPLDDAWLAGRFGFPTPVARAVRSVAFRPPGSGSLSAQEVDGPPEGLDRLWAQVAPTVAYGVVRDAAWWRWRYAEHPHAPYRFFAVHRGTELVGAAVALAREAFGGRFLCVLELLVTDVAAARALTRALAAERRGAVGAALVAVPGSPLDRLAPRTGFRRLPRRLEPKPLLFGAVPHETGGGTADPADRWSVAWGDLDHL